MDFVIVYGALRSGTTVFRLMLDMHPRLSCPDETDFLFDHLRPAAPGGPAAVYDLEALRADRIFRATGIAAPQDPAGRAGAQAMIAALKGDRPGVIALIVHRHLGRILDLFPDARIIHMVRDPRDVARSSIGMGWAGHVYHGVHHWLDTERAWDADAHRIPAGNALEMRYEALIREPEATLSSVCRFVGLDYDPAMLTYEGRTTYDRPDISLVEQWRRKQTQDELSLVEGRVGALLTARGYAPSGAAPRSPGAGEAARLWLRDKRAVWSSLIRRYGVVDPVVRGLGRRLGLHGVARAAQARIDAKLVRYLK